MAGSRPRRKTTGPCRPAGGFQARGATEALAIQRKEEPERPILSMASAGRRARASAAAGAEREGAAAAEAKAAVEAAGASPSPAAAATASCRGAPPKR